MHTVHLLDECSAASRLMALACCIVGISYGGACCAAGAAVRQAEAAGQRRQVLLDICIAPPTVVRVARELAD